MLRDWLAVFEALKDCYIDEAFSNIAINEAVENHKDCSSGFVRAFTKGVLRDSLKLDYYIDNLADKGVKAIKNRTLIILRMGLYAIDSLDSVPSYAAVNQTVSLAKKVSKGSDRFVNAILRRYLREKDILQVADDNLSLKYSFPKDLCDLIVSQYGDEAEDVLRSLNNVPELIIRANLNKTTREELKRNLEEIGIECDLIEGSNIALVVRNGQIVNTRFFHDGLLSIQSLSSIRSIEAFAPKKGSRVLDMCAAPGGKTCGMAELMGNEGEIIACDIHPHRLDLINAVAARLDTQIITTELLDGTETKDEFIESFDYVLADVPCSGLGVVGSKPEIKLRTDVSRFKELESIQKDILENAYRYTKPGGRLMYSTCTINKDENEAIVDSFIASHEAEILEKCLILPYNNELVGFFYCIVEKPANRV